MGVPEIKRRTVGVMKWALPVQMAHTGKGCALLLLISIVMMFNVGTQVTCLLHLRYSRIEDKLLSI